MVELSMPASLLKLLWRFRVSLGIARTAKAVWRVIAPGPYYVDGDLMRFRLELRRQLGAFAEEVFFHLFEQELLGFGLAEVEAVLVHDHLHVLDPTLPGFFGNVLVDALPQRVPVKGNFVEAGGFLLQL